MQLFFKYNWPSIFWAAFILGICLMPGKDLPSVSVFQVDKIIHFACYFLLACLLYFGWSKQTYVACLHSNLLLKLLLLTCSYGFIIEVMQETLTKDRHFDSWDALANCAGAVAGSFFSEKVGKYKL